MAVQTSKGKRMDVSTTKRNLKTNFNQRSSSSMPTEKKGKVAQAKRRTQAAGCPTREYYPYRKSLSHTAGTTALRGKEGAVEKRAGTTASNVKEGAVQKGGTQAAGCPTREYYPYRKSLSHTAGTTALRGKEGAVEERAGTTASNVKEGAVQKGGYDCNADPTGSHHSIKGLKNMGMTCYANSIFQVLAKTPGFLISPPTSVVPRNPNLSSCLHNLLSWLDGKDEHIKEEILVKDVLDRVSPVDGAFSRGRQRDCLSFLMSLLVDIKKEELGKDVKENRSWSLFEGQLYNKLTFLPCKHGRCTEPQMFTSLVIPQRESSKYTIEMGLQHLLETEVLRGTETFQCGENHDDQAAPTESVQKTMLVLKYPKILVLQIERSEKVADFGRSFSLKKNSNFVDYDDTLKVKEIIKGKPTDAYYSLYAVINHIGSLHGGHYYAYVKDRNVWYECDDDRVRQILHTDVVKSKAYLLFYSRT